MAHGGGSSLRVDGQGGYCNHVFWSAGDDVLSTFGTEVHVRFFVRFETALGEDHVTFLATHDDVSGRDLRMGGQKGVFMWNRETDDATLPELSPAGTAASAKPVPSTWHCLEVNLNRTNGAITTSIDGASVAGLTTGGGFDGQWSKSANMLGPTDLRLGWESYGGSANTVWFDDVVVSASPIGCAD